MKEEKRLAELKGGHPSGPLSYISPSCRARATAIERADIPEDEIPSDAVRLDRDTGTGCKVYGWIEDDGTVRLWTDAMQSH